MNDRLWIFQVEFYDLTRRLERFMSGRRISETLAGAIKYAESVVEHTEHTDCTNDSWPSISVAVVKFGQSTVLGTNI